MGNQQNGEKPDLPLWAGLWVPFAVVVFVLAKTGLFSVPVAIGIDLVSAVLVTVVARAAQRRKAGRGRA